MRILLAFIVAISLLFFAANCKKEPMPDPCKKVWHKGFLKGVRADTTDHLRIIVPDSLIPGNNAILWQDSLLGEFSIRLSIEDFVPGNSNGTYFKVIVSNGPPNQPTSVASGVFTHSDTLEGLQVGCIVDSAGIILPGFEPRYEIAKFTTNYIFEIRRYEFNGVGFVQVTAIGRKNTLLFSSISHKTPFNLMPCKVTLALGSNNGIIKGPVSVKLIEFEKMDSTKLYGERDYFRCNNIID